MVRSQEAERVMAEPVYRLARVSPRELVKTAAFRTVAGREIALDRQRTTAFFVWVETYEVSIPGVAVRNVKHPGHPYAPHQSRAHSLTRWAPKLAEGDQAWHLGVVSIDALRTLLDWYANLP